MKQRYHTDPDNRRAPILEVIDGGKENHIGTLVSRYKQYATENGINIEEELKNVGVPASLEINPRPVSESDIEGIIRDENTFRADIWEGRNGGGTK